MSMFFFQTRNCAASEDFETLAKATAHFDDTSLSGESCSLLMVTHHAERGPNGSYFSCEVLAQRVAEMSEP